MSARGDGKLRHLSWYERGFGGSYTHWLVVSLSPGFSSFRESGFWAFYVLGRMGIFSLVLGSESWYLNWIDTFYVYVHLLRGSEPLTCRVIAYVWSVRRCGWERIQTPGRYPRNTACRSFKADKSGQALQQDIVLRDPSRK